MLFLAKLFAVITVGLHLFIRPMRCWSSQEIDHLVGTHLMSLQLVMLAVFGLVLLPRRKVERSQFELRVIDALLAVSPSYEPMIAFAELSPYMRPELLALQLVSHVTMARALMAPSTARRTAVLSVLGLTPLIAWTYWFYAQHADPNLPASYIFTAPVFAWTAAGSALLTIISYTIFGLRKKVVEASQIGHYVLERQDRPR